MFGGLAAAYRYKRGFRTYRSTARAYHRGKFAKRMPYRPARGVKRYIPRNPLASANRTVTTLHRLEQYNGGTGSYAINFVSGVLDVHQYIKPMVSEFPGTGPYKTLYRQFRIKKVILEFFPVNSQARFSEGTEEDFCQLYTPTLYTSINRVDSDNADNITKMCSTNNMRSVIAGRYHKRVWKPNLLSQIYESGVTTAYNPVYDQWLSTEDTSAPHYGCDVLLSSTASPKCSFKYKLRTTVIVQWKNRKPNVDLS